MILHMRLDIGTGLDRVARITGPATPPWDGAIAEWRVGTADWQATWHTTEDRARAVFGAALRDLGIELDVAVEIAATHLEPNHYTAARNYLGTATLHRFSPPKGTGT